MRCRGVEKNGGQGSRVVVLWTFFSLLGVLGDLARVLAITFFSMNPQPEKRHGFKSRVSSNMCRINSTSLPWENIKLWGKFRAFFVVNIPVFSETAPQASHGQVPCEACSETCWKLSKWRHGDMDIMDIATAGFCGWMFHKRKEVFESTIPKRLQGWSIHQRFVRDVFRGTEAKHW